MNPFVDFFVLVECKKTFTFKDKPLYFRENMDQFKEFHHKIIHWVIDFDIISDWGNEAHQRNCIKAALEASGANDNDLCFLSDLDEIPNLQGFDFSKVGQDVYSFNHQYYYYFLNNKMSLTQYITKLFSFGHLHFKSVHEMRGWEPLIFDDKMGWHFSFMGGIEQIKKKIDAFAHQDLNLPEFTGDQILTERINKNHDLFNRSFGFEVVPVDDRFPEFLVKNKEQFKHLLK